MRWIALFAVHPACLSLAEAYMKTIRAVFAALALMFVVAFAPGVAAQQWPSKPVKLIAVFPAGGSVDQVSRVIA
jgi:tripartite-type tricarboxylate transporter receptor subunit TctC